MSPSLALEQVLTRARSDPNFRQWLQTMPLVALANYRLSDAERQALIERDRARLVELGVPADWIAWYTI